MRQFAAVAALTAALMLGFGVLATSFVLWLGPGSCAPEDCAPVVIEAGP